MTGVLLLTMTLLHPWTPPSTFDVQTELQGLYDEISQATLQFVTESDVDVFHEVLFTDDWVFIDATGHRQTWPQARERAIQALAEPHPEALTQPIQKLSVAADGVTVLADMKTVRTIVDNEGKYGRKGDSHTLTETTTFRDRWVKVSDKWKMKSREQVKAPTVSVGKTDRAA